jgi:hypothetical protein
MKRRFSTTSILSTSALALLASLPLAAGARAAQVAPSGSVRAAADVEQGPTPERYVRAGEGGVTLLNLRDSAGQPLWRVPAGGLLAVYKESAGWLGVDVPGGFPVWVYGRYLRPSGLPGVLEVTGSAINMRPLPSRDEDSFNIRTKLMAGDRVTQIGVDDPSKPLAESWVQIISPEGAYGWVRSLETVPLLRDERGAELWAAAEAELETREGALRRRDGLEVGVTEAAAAVPASPAAAKLAEAAERMGAETEKSLPDFDAVRALFAEVRELQPDAETLLELERLSSRLDLNEELYRAAAQLEELKLERRREAQRLQAQRLQEIKPRDPLYGRFDLRGKLESFRDASGHVTYALRQGLHTAAQIECRDGRYELERFVGCDLGLVVDPIEEDAATIAVELVLVDVRRLEVLSAPIDLP